MMTTDGTPAPVPENAANGYRWTKHTFVCTDCGRKCYASQQYIDWVRQHEYIEPGTTDEQIAKDIEFCIGCVEGRIVEGECVELQPMRVFVHEAEERGWARWDARECDISECFPNTAEIDEAIRVRAELEENGYAWVGGGAAQLYLLTRKPNQH